MATDFWTEWDIIIKAADASRKSILGSGHMSIGISSVNEVQPAVTAIMKALAEKTYTPSPYDFSRCAELPDRIHLSKYDPNTLETEWGCLLSLVELKRAMAELMPKRDIIKKNQELLRAAEADIEDAVRRQNRFHKIHGNSPGHVLICADWFANSSPVRDAKDEILRALRDPDNTPISEVQLKKYSELPDTIYVLCTDRLVRKEDFVEVKNLALDRLRNKQFVNPGCGAMILFVASTLAMTAIHAALSL